jgi:hypothetical protein
MIKKWLSVLILLSISALSFGQTNSSNKITDSLQVVKLAKRQNLFLNNDWVFPPVVTFDKEKNEWTLDSVETGYTEEGNCKHTNGCTTFHYIILIIDAETGNIKSKEEKTTIHPNYE